MVNIKRNMSTQASRDFWKRAEEAAAEVRTWPDWKRAGINVVTERPLPAEAATAENDMATKGEG